MASSNQPTTGPLRVSDLAAPNIFRLSRRGDAVLVQESANDHEALHTYSLHGIVMYQDNALLSACEECTEATGGLSH